MELTPEAARKVLAGETSLSSLLGVSREELARMAQFGYELWQQGRRNESMKMFQALLAADESLYYGHAGMGLIAMREENLQDARRYLSRALELEPRDPAVAVNLGEVLLRLGKLPEAVATMEKAIQADPTLKNAGAARAAAILTGIGHGMTELTKAAQ